MTTPPPTLLASLDAQIRALPLICDGDGCRFYLPESVWRDVSTALEALAAERDALKAENEKLTRDRDTLMMFAQSIQTWRVDADSYDRECGHVARDYCEDVDLMQASATNTLRRIRNRATLNGATQP